MNRTDLIATEGAGAARARLERRLRGGANWFFCIAALACLNTIAFVTGGDWGVVVGLGASEVFHALARVGTIDGGAAAPWLLAFAVAADLLSAGVLALAGLFARRRLEAPFALGIAFYALDGLLFLVSPERLPVAFHAAALVGLCIGFAALRRLRRLDEVDRRIAAAA